MKPSSGFPFRSRFVELRDFDLPSGARLARVRLHYVEEGDGTPILFLHGNPTSSYLWRNILPSAARYGRAIAIDLLGHGLSDKPDVSYSFDDHQAVLLAAVRELDVESCVLVVHDWGGPLGFALALQEQLDVRAIAAMETFPWRLSWDTLPWSGRVLFRAFRTPWLGRFLLQRLNLFVRLVMPLAVHRRRSFTPESRRRYSGFYPDYGSRKSLRRWPEQLPLDSTSPAWGAVYDIERRLCFWKRPLLWLAVSPGAVTSQQRLEWLQNEVPQVQVRHLGRGGHYLQEEIPDKIAAALEDWLPGVVSEVGG